MLGARVECCNGFLQSGFNWVTAAPIGPSQWLPRLGGRSARPPSRVLAVDVLVPVGDAGLIERPCLRRCLPDYPFFRVLVAG